MILKETDVTFQSETQLSYLRWNYVLERAGLAPHEFRDIVHPYLDKNINVVAINRGGTYDLFVAAEQSSQGLEHLISSASPQNQEEEYICYRGVKTKLKQRTENNPYEDISGSVIGSIIPHPEEEERYIYYRGVKTKIKQVAAANATLLAGNEISYRGSKPRARP